MATQPTNLPVPSESPRDLKFNAGKIDEFVTSRELKYIDRFGGEHYTIEGISQLSKEAIASFGYITMDSFEGGNTLTLPNQVLRLEATGEYYRWDGTFPKTVPAASTPESTGGIGVGAWLSVGDATLRAMLASPAGAGLVGVIGGGTVSDNIHVITPEMHGAVGDGVTDDSDAIQSAIDYAASKGMRVQGTGKTYATSKAIKIKTGLMSLERLRIIALSDSQTMITNSDDFVGSSCDINENFLDANGKATIGILVYGINKSKINNNKIINLTKQSCYGIRIGVISGNFVSSNNVISGNCVFMGADPDGGTGTITMTGIALVGQISGDYGGLEVAGEPIWPTVLTVVNTSVMNNYAFGGTHSFIARGVFRADVHGNYFEGPSHRNMNITPNSQRLNIYGNHLIEAGSSAININAANRWINIHGNYIQSTTSSTVSSDDAAIQATSYAEGIVITGNIILGDWKYCVRMSEAILCSINGNNFTQGASVANIYIETDWLASADIPADAPYTRAHTRTYTCVNNTQFINISDNNHAGRSAAVALAQFGTKQLIGVSVSDEIVSGAATRTHVYHLCNQNSAASSLSLSDINAGGATPSKYYSFLGRLPFVNINNVVGWSNTNTNISTATTYLNGSTRYTLTSTTVGCSNFIGGKEGDRIIVRSGVIGTTLINNVGIIRLKNNVNWVSSSASEMITLYNVDGIWFEESRNF